MKKRATFSILFYIKRTKSLNNDEVSLFGRDTVNGQSSEFLLCRSIKPELWNTLKKRHQVIANELEPDLDKLYKLGKK